MGRVDFQGGRTLYTSELLDSQVVYLLTVEFAGRFWRWSFPGSIDLTDADGNAYHFHGMDNPDQPVQSMDFETDSPADTSISIRGLHFYGDIDLPKLVAQGHDLSTMKGELAAISDASGKTMEDRHVIIRGDVADPTYADPNRPSNTVDLTLESPIYEDTALFPSTFITEENFSNSPDEAQGLVFPWVFGRPGVFQDYDGTQNERPITPAPVIDSSNELLMIAGHSTALGRAGGAIDIYDRTNEAFANSLTVGVAADGNGIQYSFVDITGAFPGTVGYTDNAEYFSQGWAATPYEAQRGGYPSFEDWDEPLDKAGDVLYFMLLQSSLEVDTGRAAVARELLNGLYISGYIDVQVTPYDWIVDVLGPILPMTLTSGPDGVYPIVWRYGATEKDSVLTVTAGPGWHRTSGVEYEDTETYNKVTVNYCPNAFDSGNYERTLTLDGSLDDYANSGDFTVRPNYYARLGFLQDGEIKELEISTDLIWNDEDAAVIAFQALRAKALRHRRVSYSAHFRYAWLEPGDVISVTDDALYWDSKLALVGSKTWDVTGLEFQLIILEDPPRDSIASTALA